MEIQSNYQLSKLTTFQIGGPADFFVDIKNLDELSEALNFAQEKKLPVLVLGGGSNVLISNEGFRGLVIRNQFKGITFQDSEQITVAAGENWDDVVVAAIGKGLGGLECLSGIPGSAGGAVVQNIGAYGQTLADVVVSVEAVEIASGQNRTFTKQECGFEYRDSWFKKNPGKFLITSFTVKLSSEKNGNTSYQDVQKYFSDHKLEPTLANVRKAILEIRNSKGMLVMSGFEVYKSAGSFFKNPVVEKEVFEKVKSALVSEDSRQWFWTQEEGKVKISAARLLLAAGFFKGQVEGNVGISPKQPLAIINLGQASALDVKQFAQKIQNVVLNKFGVKLEEEILYV